MYIILKDYDNGEMYEENYSFVNQVVTVANGDSGRVLTFATIDEVRAYVQARYEHERTSDTQIVRNDDSAFSYSDGYDEITGYKWVDLNNPVIPVTASNLIADFWDNR